MKILFKSTFQNVYLSQNESLNNASFKQLVKSICLLLSNPLFFRLLCLKETSESTNRLGVGEHEG